MSSSGGTNPRWSRTKASCSTSLAIRFWQFPTRSKGEALEPDKPAVRVETLGGTQWDLARDGRIALIAPVNPADGRENAPAEHTVVFLQNLFDEVRRRVR
jgi:hypothetical protein